MKTFAERFRVIRYDLRNHGRSPRCAGSFDAQLDLLELLDLVGAEAPCLAGLGGGGAITLDFALQQPRRVSSLVLAGSGVSPGRSHVFRLLDMSELAKDVRPMMPEVLRAARGGDPAPAIDKIVTSRLGPKHQAARDLLRRIYHDNAHLFTQDPNAMLKKTANGPAADRLSEISVPTLVMVGDHDWAHARGIADFLHEGITGSQKVIIEDAGSYPNLDEPELFSDTIMRFLGDITPAAADGR